MSGKIKKICSCVVALFIFCTVFSCMAYAAGDVNVVIGNKLTFQEGNEPFIYNGYTMMPLRAVSEALDATVFWFGGDKKMIQIVNYDTLLSLQIDNNMMGKYKVQDGEPVHEKDIKLDVVAMIQNDRTYVPLRAIAEAFDANISWDNPNRTANIIPSKKNENNVSIAEMLTLPANTLCATYGVICKDKETGLFYLRSLTRNELGSYAQISFCTPVKTSISDETQYEEYVSQYFTEQFGTDDPTGVVVKFTGVTAVLEDGVVRATLNKTTTGMKSLGKYDEYMKSIGVDCVPFEN